MKPILFSGHARDNLRYRGATEDEVIETIRSAPWEPVDLRRLECHKDFVYRTVWNGRFYEMKRVRPIFCGNGQPDH